MHVIRLGHMGYGKAVEIQEMLQNLRLEKRIGDCLLLVEHPSVLTMGRNAKSGNILASVQWLEAQGVSVHEVKRGGDVTYHGPGQVVGYPILDLQSWGKDIKKYIWMLEEVFIRLLADEYHIDAHREDKKYTGVWVGDDKITAIGVYVKQWVTMHGFAFNVNANLNYFRWINPCGITDKGVTSLQKVLGRQLDFEDVNRLVAQYFCEVFEVEPDAADIGDIIKDAHNA